MTRQPQQLHILGHIAGKAKWADYASAQQPDCGQPGQLKPEVVDVWDLSRTLSQVT